MHRPGFAAGVLVAASVIVTVLTLRAATVSASESYTLTGPYKHRNLAIYLIHREGSDSGPVPLTLGEAMVQGFVKVTETDTIEELTVRNLGGQEVFIQSGDIVRGGLQDRVLTVSMILPPDSGDIPIGAFCVEQGRWARRGQEKATEFSASTALAPSRAARMAIAERTRREIVSGTDNPERLHRELQRPDGESLQSQVWHSVRKVQENLGRAMEADVTDERSPSSLQLSLENKALASVLEDYGATLGALPEEHPGAVGYVFAINGKINSGDEFGSAGLFRKLWPRQLKAAATGAIAEKSMAPDNQPTLAEVAEFIDRARAAEPLDKSMPGRMSLEIRQTEKAMYTEIRHRNGRWVHRSYIAYQ